MATHVHEMTAAQREAWSAVEAYTECLSRRDWEGFFSHFHDDFVGWTLRRPTPVTKETRQKWVPFVYRATEILEYEIQPLSVRIYGNVAVCHYLTFKAKKEGDGEVSLEKEKWSDVLIKQDGRWLLVSDSGGPFD
jgi:ketosteroid isomerase-like protein